jgi:hypothetical protein
VTEPPSDVVTTTFHKPGVTPAPMTAEPLTWVAVPGVAVVTILAEPVRVNVTVVKPGSKLVPVIEYVRVVLRNAVVGDTAVMVGAGNAVAEKRLVPGVDPPLTVLMLTLYAPIQAFAGMAMVPLIRVVVTVVSVVGLRIEPVAFLMTTVVWPGTKFVPTIV